MFTCEEYRKKEIERVNAHKVKKKQQQFRRETQGGNKKMEGK